MNKELNIFVTTYNLGLQGSKATIKDLTEWLVPNLTDFSAKSPPDLVVIGAQEITDLASAYAGLSAPLLSVLGLKVSSILSEHASSLLPEGSVPANEHYTLLSSSAHVNVGLWIFALDRTVSGAYASTDGQKAKIVGEVSTSSVALGFLGGLVGNKAAVGGRVWLRRRVEKNEVGLPLESLTFVCAHFAPHANAKAVASRIGNYERLTTHLRFPSLPSNVSSGVYTRSPGKKFPRSSFNTTNHVFLFGDLNYRLSSTSQGKDFPPDNVFRQMMADLDRAGRSWGGLAVYDQLGDVQRTGKSLVGFNEVPLGEFGPTYKRVIGNPAAYSPKRLPAFTDRILFASRGRDERAIRPERYSSVVTLGLSDHVPVVLTLAIPCPDVEDGKESDDGEDGARSLVIPVQTSGKLAWEIRIVAEAKLGAALDLSFGYGWLGLIGLGCGQGEVVGGAVGLALVLLMWYLASN
ncbi:Inositol-1,4,5-triphosphate 5-phosphatase (synaptojanin), INP51/INP52/INP53 family [Phaffia rhodozyma]|uniref:Inositol-1,4,5-triphosphate 5-phosphatase (Synaptojanin), INP51/INP52/INP53 family n=1 Tax=Phaffia rhodozyma TaxID=264483 RepID=A0A0F7SF21_PHARH|nr:Inositol-1,4,5-triphosphate 5-phosphatase (synaptojanin), INP51/INP52/INP53 family [Phaffia rhodozyma]